MMMIKQWLHWNKLILAIGAIAMLHSCSAPNVEQFTVKGEIANAGGQKIMLAELPYASPNRIVVDSTTADSAGHFELQTIQSQESIYQLFVVNGPGFLLINDAANIGIAANAKFPENYTITGSAASESIRALYKRFVPVHDRLQMENAKTLAPVPTGIIGDSLRTAALQQRDKTQLELQHVFTNFLAAEKNPTAQYFALGMAKNFLPASTWQGSVDSALHKWPTHPGIALMKVGAAGTTAQGTHLLNKSVPELVLPDTSGKAVAISSFRGKWLLIDCWASWCAPCRKENPNLVKAFRMYGKKNFTILSISLDKSKQEWIAAIGKDSLTWPQISDLAFWDSKAVAAFDVQALPFNLLVDPTGTVKATNLTDSLLLQTLKQYLR